MGAKNLAPTGILSPDRPARSESLYQLRYRGPYITIKQVHYSSPLKHSNIENIYIIVDEIRRRTNLYLFKMYLICNPALLKIIICSIYLYKPVYIKTLNFAGDPC
jgi:hypothetical protein